MVSRGLLPCFCGWPAIGVRHGLRRRVAMSMSWIPCSTSSRNTEQLAGTLCHEVSHTIHKDGVELMAKSNRIKRHEIEAAILLGPTRAHVIANPPARQAALAQLFP